MGNLHTRQDLTTCSHPLITIVTLNHQRPLLLLVMTMKIPTFLVPEWGTWITCWGTLHSRIAKLPCLSVLIKNCLLQPSLQLLCKKTLLYFATFIWQFNGYMFVNNIFLCFSRCCVEDPVTSNTRIPGNISDTYMKRKKPIKDLVPSTFL